MSEDSDLERTHPATPRRLEQAAEEGQVAHSLELNTFLMLMTGTAGLWLLGASVVDRLSQLLAHGLTFEARAVTDPVAMIGRLYEFAGEGLLALLPLFGLLFAAAFIAPLALTGRLQFAAIRFDAAHVNPLSGFARMFSSHGAMELVKAIVKTLIVGGIAAWALSRDLEQLLRLVDLGPEAGIRSLGSIVGLTTFIVVGGLLLVAALDVPFQLWSFFRRLRMTREEVRQEMKETDGDPFVKGQIRRAQREAARRRMMNEVPTADVIVTNPTHYAVALRYDGEKMRAPRVVAKGADLVARRIRELGAEHRVPVLEAPPLARALYHHTELGDEIPEALYTTVAEVLAYVFQLRRHQTAGGPAPVAPEHLAVPAELDPLGDRT